MSDNVTYVPFSPTESGALPKNTTFKTTETDGVHVQHTNIDELPLATGAATEGAQDEMTLYLYQMISLLTKLVDEQKETNNILRKMYQ